MRKIIVSGFLLMIGTTQFLAAQTKYKIQETKDIDMKLSGTSTLHNWTMETQTFTGEAQFGFKTGNVQLNSLKSLSFDLNVTGSKKWRKRFG